MSELDISIIDQENESLPVEFHLLPLEGHHQSFEEVMSEMENKIKHLEDYLKLLADEKYHDEISEEPVPPTLQTWQGVYRGKFRDWLINAEELPAFMKPIITAQKPISDEHKSYQTVEIGLLNSQQEFRTLYASVVSQNVFFGAVGGLGMGYICNMFKMPTSVYTARYGWTKDITKITMGANIKSVSYMSVGYRMAKSAAVTGFLFDFFKRNAEQATGRVNHWSNSIYSAVLCGGLFGGLKGGIKGSVLGAAGLSISAYAWEVCPTLHSVT